MGEDSEYKGDYTHLPWVWVIWAIYWKRQSCGLTQGRQAPLAGYRAMWTNRRTVGKPGLPSPGACAQGLLPSQGEEDWLRPHLWLPIFPTTTHPYTCPAYFAWLLCTGAGAAMMRQRTGMWEAEVHLAQGGIWVEQLGPCIGGHLHRQPIGRCPDLWWRPDCCSNNPVCAQSPWGPHLPNRNPLQHGRATEAVGTDQLWGTKRSQTRSYV